ncbi:long-chain-fatty-acid--CoA ligase [Hyalangium rubrum]|uniref:Long-chain fatty acid--CoA ligase n=1 Tax=Hyalangium rubrum TaxID=3103134 RepID=A0ABU5H1B0_9BACT|nr:long-chain fatty acid--CoA ligase [Hyalangium sp. s54d21]MDY7226528.1 long-chain fatty acid--CoA ligase [Hyalangium sp. s54d21]
MNIAQGLEAAARRRPEHPALRMDALVLTYRELLEAVNRLAVGLGGEGLRAGERVCLFLPNGPEFVIAYFAVLKLGAVAVSVSVMSKAEELRHIVNDSQAAVLLTRRELLPQVPGREQLPTVRLLLAEEAGDGVRSYAELLQRPAAACPVAPVERDTPAAILYTSGTTGRPKGAVLSHGNVVSNVASTRQIVGMRDDDRMLCFLPLFHCFGQNFIMNATLASGATLLLRRRFVPEDVLEVAERHGATVFYGVPTVYMALLHQPHAAQALRAVRYFFSAAAILPVEVERAWHTHTGLHIHEGYGLTETSPSACYNHTHQWRSGSVGTPIEGVEMRVIDEQGQGVPDGELGELCIKGPNVMLGYFNQPEETARALVDGWLRSGDIGYRDAQGYYFLVDRLKDMINVAGFKVWPREVEEVLFRHPKVKESAVVGMPDDYRGEAVKAFIVLKPGEEATAEELREHCREHLSNYKVPRHVEQVEALPKNATGKVLKKELRARESGTR